ncbi:VCBS repeat-containing protein [Pelagicoccus albus]|uniref:VCBS repeat-containing protein n=1 Tax=Pelagicoccus albus TaxID=415222 RepID=A0A7X1B8A7_9BACT|nr:VCBS repeat-containing protein [Pelagicoccus albus]MBC2606253.1 VCBS repeat-containing protein [Pelagicoccus albus]
MQKNLVLLALSSACVGALLPAPSKAQRFETLEHGFTGLELFNEYKDPMMWSSRFREFTLGAVSVGIASGDLNGDGRPDLYAVNKTGPNGLFIQTDEPFVFENNTEESGTSGTDSWETGVSLVDIDNDSDLDIYLCVYDAPNQLYLNDGSGHFREAAAEFGLDLSDASVMASFCDYDRDGDLDVYIQTNILEFARHTKGSPDYLYRNNGDNTFTDVSSDSGIWGRSQGHSATWWDYNNDGWMDLYVANDFETPDRFYKNNGDGTFTDSIEELIPLSTFFSMGSDLGDLDNDGWMDFMVADMEAADHYKDMTGMEERSRGIWDTESVFDLTPQYARNAIYLNTGLDRFREAAYLFGVPGTNWTWSVKLRDLDNDGWLDLYITNGMVRNLIDADLVDRQNTARTLAHRAAVVRNSEPLKEKNFAFRNNGKLQFEDVGSQWNLDQENVAFGSTICDFDRDGDLDIAYLGMDQNIVICRNDLGSENQSLNLRLKGRVSNSWGIGASIRIETEEGKQLRQLSLARGIVSSDEPLIHFGLGEADKVDKLVVTWPSGIVQELKDLAANPYLVIEEPDLEPTQEALQVPKPLFVRKPELERIWPTHQQSDSAEFNRAPLLPRRLGEDGPALATGDLNGDQKTDYYIGGGSGQSGMLILSTGPNGDYQSSPLGLDQICEDTAAAIFDANGDGHNDLLVISGGTPRSGTEVLSDRLYLNSGDGKFERAPETHWPQDTSNASSVAIGDFDQDGDPDVFIGGASAPENYPFPAPSRLLRNESGKFNEVGSDVASALEKIGLVTDSQWVTRKGRTELAIITEWGSLRLFEFVDGRIKDVSKERGLPSKTGLWRSLDSTDLNQDGQPDLILGNLGLNTKYTASSAEPATLFAGEMEGDGQNYIVEAYYENGRLLPVRGRSKLNYTFPWITEVFPKFDQFAKSDLYEIFGEDRLSRATRFEAEELQSGAWISTEDGYRFVPFPREAQLAPTMDIAVKDWNADGQLDLVLAQNLFGQEASTGRLSGSIGCLLLGHGDGSFEAVHPSQAGILLPGNQREMVTGDLDGDGLEELIATENGGPVRIFGLQN